MVLYLIKFNLISHEKQEHIEQIINEFSHSLKENKLRPFQRTGAYQVLIAAIKNADDQNVANLQPSLLQQHLTSLELILPEIKKNMSLLFNNQVIFLAILLNKFETVLAPKVKQAFISGLTKIANDSKCKRSLSKEAKIRLRQFVTKPIMS